MQEALEVEPNSVSCLNSITCERFSVLWPWSSADAPRTAPEPSLFSPSSGREKLSSCMYSAKNWSKSRAQYCVRILSRRLD